MCIRDSILYALLLARSNEIHEEIDFQIFSVRFDSKIPPQNDLHQQSHLQRVETVSSVAITHETCTNNTKQRNGLQQRMKGGFVILFFEGSRRRIWLGYVGRE
eukprot:TRINITY_DN7603_c0_g2_i1.p1 TRINITY_DN7603_c0_g2~~TRINITY_DN7603_c0_g2_i1.p1  ORF type:complete len:103 (-),score=10.05 TRINITY_DN7603_c0_g2_i1:93-401(-)